MSVFLKIVTGVFGKKSDKDLKALSPFIDKVNDYYKTLSDLSDEELKSKYLSMSKEFENTEKDFKDNSKDVLDDDLVSNAVDKAIEAEVAMKNAYAALKVAVESYQFRSSQ